MTDSSPAKPKTSIIQGDETSKFWFLVSVFKLFQTLYMLLIYINGFNAGFTRAAKTQYHKTNQIIRKLGLKIVAFYEFKIAWPNSFCKLQYRLQIFLRFHLYGIINNFVSHNTPRQVEAYKEFVLRIHPTF